MPNGLVWVCLVAGSEYAFFVQIAIVLDVYNLVAVCACIKGNLPLLTLWAYGVDCALEDWGAACDIRLRIGQVPTVVHYIVGAVLEYLCREHIQTVVVVLLVLCDKLAGTLLDERLHVE